MVFYGFSALLLQNTAFWNRSVYPRLFIRLETMDLPESVRPDPSASLRTEGSVEGLGFTVRVVRPFDKLTAHHERANEQSEFI
jgi:hypothetical protein